MNLLAIDTSTDFCSVAASRGEALFARHERAGQRHAERILDMVDQVLVEAWLEFAQIQGIACGAGAGSFTGLRIAAGVTQGLALARGIGVVGIGTLLALAEEAAEEAAQEAAGSRIIACLDAHKGEVYHAAYRELLAARLGECVSAVRPEAAPTARAVLKLAMPRFAAGEAKDAAAAVPEYLRDKVALKTSER